MTITEFYRRFNFNTPVNYDPQCLERLVKAGTNDQLRPAAVLIGLVERGNRLHVILTKRAAHLKHHPGQVSFPGGKYEDSDINLAHTAIRETFEEIGIPTDKIELVGTLPALPTISRFAVTPFIARVNQDYQAKIDHNEVAEVFEVPASFLFQPKNLFHHHFQLRTSRHKIFALPYQHHFIWGVTAQIIDALQRQLDI